MDIKEEIKKHLDSISNNDKDIEEAKREIAKYQRLKDFAEKSNVWYQEQIRKLSAVLTKIEAGEVFEFNKTYSCGEFSYTFKYKAKKISNIKSTCIYTEYTVQCVIENARKKLSENEEGEKIWKNLVTDPMVYEVQFINEGGISNFVVDESIQLLFKDSGYNIPFDKLKDNDYDSRSR